MLLIGDKIKQVKAIDGFNFVGREFVIQDIKGTNIVFYRIGLGKGVMTIAEFNEHFEKIVEPTWSEWEKLGFYKEYRVKGDLIEMRLTSGGSSVFSKPCEEDEFDLQKGLAVCTYKLDIKGYEKDIKDLQKVIDICKRKIENI